MRKYFNLFLLLFIAIMMSSCTMTDDNTDIEPDDDVITDRIEFGKYPQNEVFDLELCDILSDLSVNDNGYIEYDEKEYCKVDNRYFEVSPIIWKKININGKDMYITDKIIDNVVFLNWDYFDVCSQPYSNKPGTPSGIYANNYTYSDLREYLNNDFFNKAFNDEEKAKLNKIAYDENKDYVYTLSLSDINDSIYLPASATAYSVAMGVEQIYDNDVNNVFNGNSIWWLRDANKVQLWRAASINYEGILIEYVDCHYEHVGVRPVIYINE